MLESQEGIEPIHLLFKGQRHIHCAIGPLYPAEALPIETYRDRIHPGLGRDSNTHAPHLADL